MATRWISTPRPAFRLRFATRRASMALGILALAAVTGSSRSDDGAVMQNATSKDSDITRVMDVALIRDVADTSRADVGEDRLVAAARRPDGGERLQQPDVVVRQDILRTMDALSISDAASSAAGGLPSNGTDPEVAAALTTIANAGAAGVDVLSAPPPAEPDWNKLAAEADRVATSETQYQTAGKGMSTLAAWAYAGANRSANVSMTGSNLVSDDFATLGANAAATFTPGPFQFNVGMGGSDSGAWNGLAGSQLALGALKFNASSNLGSTIGVPGAGQMGYAVSASDDLTDQVSVNGGLNWSRPLTSDLGNWAYQGALQLKHELTGDLKLVGELGVAASGPDYWEVSRQAHATTGMQWTPGGGSAISATFTDPFNGNYTLATAASRPFD